MGNQLMPKIRVMPIEREIDFEPGKTLLELLLQAGVFVDNPCRGNGVCGKCKVCVSNGNVGNPTPEEEKYLTDDELQIGVRLACRVVPENDVNVTLIKTEGESRILTTGYLPEFTYSPGIEKRVFKIRRPSLEWQIPLENQIIEALSIPTVGIDVLTHRQLEPGLYTGVLEGGKLLDIERGDTTKRLFGVAVDIGTTTIVMTLVDMLTGHELAGTSTLNTQERYGSDVLTRITYELENPQDGVKNLQTAVVDSLNSMIADTCRQANVRKDEIYEITIAANCTMMHMLLGVSALSLGQSPYAPVFVNGRSLPAAEIGLEASYSAKLYCLPSVSSYIGADIVAGAYVCRLHKTDKNALFIDIGTNGEIVLAYDGKLLSCSCAAGPALEGMNISAGMRAAEGAIEDVRITKSGIKLAVIGNQPPEGICGSGILAVIRELLKAGLIKSNGSFINLDELPKDDYRYSMLRLNGKKREFILASKPENLLVTQRDVRQVQLAKGAILSGFYALLQKAGITMDELDKVMIAGQFGAHIPADSLTGTGIIPKEVENKLVYVGNSSKTGAYMALMSEKVKREMEELARHMEYLELSATKNYDRLFAKCLIYPGSSVNTCNRK